jgi:hypothetical protein
MQNRENKVGKKELKNPFQEKELVFSFKYFGTQIAPDGCGQNFTEWELDNLSSLLKELRSIINAYQKDIPQTEELYIKLLFEEFIEKTNKIINEFDKDKTKKQSLLVDFCQKLVDLSKSTPQQAKDGGNRRTKSSFGVYPNFKFEKDSNFKEPPFPLPDKAVWGAIKRIGGVAPRVAGFLDGNVFYIVFLDRGHDFYKGKEE